MTTLPKSYFNIEDYCRDADRKGFESSTTNFGARTDVSDYTRGAEEHMPNRYGVWDPVQCVVYPIRIDSEGHYFDKHYNCKRNIAKKVNACAEPFLILRNLVACVLPNHTKSNAKGRSKSYRKRFSKRFST